MIIQTLANGDPALAIMMHEHNALCQQLCHAFGNSEFEAMDPLDLVIYAISHHDAGWLEFDRNPELDGRTGLPYNLGDTPPKHIVRTSVLSPDFNEKHHAFCGLLSSMHSWGLYNGRYGLSDLVLLDQILEDDRPTTEAMLKGELERQERLKAELAKDPETAAWIEERKLLQCYKHLQFIDTLALYFNRVHKYARKEQTFTNVPVSKDRDVSVTIKPVGAGTYAMSPFPFATSGAEFAFAGHPITESVRANPKQIGRSETDWEHFRLVEG